MQFAKTFIRPIIIIIERINLWYVRKCNAREDRHSHYKGNYMVEVEHEKLRKAIIHVHNTEPVIVSYPAPNPHAGKGLVTLERFLGCTDA